MGKFLNDYTNMIITIVIALLACLTINRGIYLYFDNQYKDIDKRIKEHHKKYKLNSYIPLINRKTNLEEIGNNVEDERNNVEDERNKNYNLIKDDEKKLNILHFRIQLLGSVILLLVSFFIKKNQIKFGFMIASFINIFFNSVRNWYNINEAEKFSITAISLFVVVFFVIKFID